MKEKKVEKKTKHRTIDITNNPILENIFSNDYPPGLMVSDHLVRFVNICPCTNLETYGKVKVEKDCRFCGGIGFKLTEEAKAILQLIEIKKEYDKQKDIVEYERKEE
jgi:hypothetical protein